jgi:hypothetical protein
MILLLEKPRMEVVDPTIAGRLIIGPHAAGDTVEATQPLQEGEFVIIKDDPKAATCYCAEIRKVLADRIEVNYYIAITPALSNYPESSITQRKERLEEASFLRT